MSNKAIDNGDAPMYATLAFTRDAGEDYETIPLQGVFLSDNAKAMASTWGDLQSDGQVFLMKHLIEGIGYLDLPHPYAGKEIMEMIHRLFLYNKKTIVDNILSNANGLRAVCVETAAYVDDLKIKDDQVVSFSGELPIDFNTLNWERNSSGALVLSGWGLTPLYHKDFSRVVSPADSSCGNHANMQVGSCNESSKAVVG